jgi:sugar/nucleoside kinase (ribokinase family)
VSVDLPRLGAPFPLFAAGLVGDDAAGMDIRHDCHRYGIDTRQLHITKDAPTSYTDVMTVQSFQRYQALVRVLETRPRVRLSP